MNSVILDEAGLRLARPTVCSLQASLHYQLITTTIAQNLLGWDTLVGVSPPSGSSPQLTGPDFRQIFKGLGLPKTTSAFGTCIQKYIIERYVCFIVFMVIAQTHVQAVATVH